MVCATHLVAYIRGHVLVELLLCRKQRVGRGLGNAIGKEWRPVELDEVFLHHPSHEVRDIRARCVGVRSLRVVSRKSVVIDQAHPELEVLVFAVVRCGRHQQEVPRDLRTTEQLAERVSLRLGELLAEVVRGELVCLIDDDEVPMRPFGLELRLPVFLARELIEPRNEEVVLYERISSLRGLD